MSKFRVGDRVVYDGDDTHWKGMTGTVADDDGGIYVRFYPDADATYADGSPVNDMYHTGRGAGMDRNGFRLITEDLAPAIDAHYTKYAIQPMEFSLANGLDPAQHTVIKYTVRYRDKGGVRDLRAAIRVLELMIEREERKASDNG